MREWKKSLIRTRLFEFGLFQSESTRPGERRHSRALSHLIAFPRIATCIQQAGRSRQLASPLRAVFYNKGCEYTAEPIGSNHERTYFLRIDASVIADAARSFNPRAAENPDSPFELTEGPVSDQLFLAQAGIARSGADLDGLHADETLMALLRNTVGAAYSERAVRSREADRSSDAEYTRWTQELLIRQFRDPLSLADISSRIGVSQFHLCRIFKRISGMTIHQFRDRLRLRAAIGEIADSSLDLSLIAARVGYSSQSHLTDAFRNRFGFTPGQARKLLRENRSFRP